jgi:hypothetical protein
MPLTLAERIRDCVASDSQARWNDPNDTLKLRGNGSQTDMLMQAAVEVEQLEADIAALKAGHLKTLRDRIEADMAYFSGIFAEKSNEEIADVLTTIVACIPNAYEAVMAAAITRLKAMPTGKRDVPE